MPARPDFWGCFYRCLYCDRRFTIAENLCYDWVLPLPCPLPLTLPFLLSLLLTKPLPYRRS